jgi:hypothetical protein
MRDLKIKISHFFVYLLTHTIPRMGGGEVVSLVWCGVRVIETPYVQYLTVHPRGGMCRLDHVLDTNYELSGPKLCTVHQCHQGWDGIVHDEYEYRRSEYTILYLRFHVPSIFRRQVQEDDNVPVQ